MGKAGFVSTLLVIWFVPHTASGFGVIVGRVLGVPNPAEVVVFIEEIADPGDHQAPPVSFAIDQIDRRFVPFVLAIRQGSTVTFHNSEDTVHNVHARLGKKTLFNFGMPPEGKAIPRRFNEVGDVRIRCDRHLTMRAWIKVFPHPFFTRPDASGEYKMPGVPPGTYWVSAWHPYARQAARAQVTVVGTSAASADFEIVLPD